MRCVETGLEHGDCEFRCVCRADNGDPTGFADRRRNGGLPTRRFRLSRRRHRHERAETGSRFHPSGSAFPQFPVVLRIPKDNSTRRFRRTADQRYLFQSIFLFATSRVPIEGRMIYFRYSVYVDAREVDLRGNIQAIDAGVLDESHLSPRRAVGRPDPPVFRIGTNYVSTERVDLHDRTVLIRSREPGDYRRLEFASRIDAPDFAFIDVTGERRRLSEFRTVTCCCISGTAAALQRGRALTRALSRRAVHVGNWP